MTTLEVVCRHRGEFDLAADREYAARYAEIKARTLPYCQVLLSHGSPFADLCIRQAPLGAVRSRVDGDRLIKALSKEFPGFRFILVTLACEQRDEAIFIPREAASNCPHGPHPRPPMVQFRLDEPPTIAG